MSRYRLLRSEGQAKDASMSLLNEILRNPLEPEYEQVAADSERKAQVRKRPMGMLLVALTVGAMFTLSAVQTTEAAPGAAKEREQLLSRIKAEEQRQDELRLRAASLRKENDESRQRLLGSNAEGRAHEQEINRLAPITGDAGVRGPGIVITVDDAPLARKDNLNRVLDKDLQQLVNGLWYAGAEAVSVNGHRLSGLTAIRGAGDAITVDYRSLTRPYKIEAIGDPKTLEARYAESQGGKLWITLHQNYQMRYEITPAKDIELGADPGLGLKQARRHP